jgi:uncharacterized protein YbaP (TraB family)
MTRRPPPLAARSLYARFVAACLAFGLILAASAPAGAATAYGNGLLWRVERAGIAPNHVFGTIHLADPRVTTLPKPVASAFDQSRTLAVELVPEPDTPIKMARAMTLGNGRSLEEILGGELFLKLIVVADGYSVPEATLRKLKPWAAMMVIAVPHEEQARRGAGQLALDLVLDARARQHGKAVVGLEKLEDQLAVFDGFPEADQIALLRQVIDTHGDMGSLSDEMIRYYLARDLGGLLDWMARQSAGDDPRLRQVFKDRLLVERNRNMSARAAALMGEGGAFVAVGAGHLPGRDGVLSLLSARGFKVTRVY